MTTPASPEEPRSGGSIPRWDTARRNVLRVVYSSGTLTSRSTRSVTGRVARISPNEITVLRQKGGVPVTISRDRVRSIVVMLEGDIAGRLRTAAVRSLIQAARDLSDPKKVGGDQKSAANHIAFAQAVISKLEGGDPQVIWDSLQDSGITIE